jgi:DnaJ-like protein
MFDKIIESIIKEAMEQGEFDNLPGKGKPIDLSTYFDMPEEVRAAYAMLKSAGITPLEVDLLKEIADLKQLLASITDNEKKKGIQQQISMKQTEFSLLMERNRHQGKNR